MIHDVHVLEGSTFELHRTWTVRDTKGELIGWHGNSLVRQHLSDVIHEPFGDLKVSHWPLIPSKPALVHPCISVLVCKSRWTVHMSHAILKHV